MEKSVRWGRSRRPSERAPNAERETCYTYRATRSDGRWRVIRTRSAPGHLSPRRERFVAWTTDFEELPNDRSPAPLESTVSSGGWCSPEHVAGAAGAEGADGARRPSPLATRRGRVTRVSPVSQQSLCEKSLTSTQGPVDPCRRALNPPRLISIPFPHSRTKFSNHSLISHHDPYLGNSASAVAVWMPPRPRHGSGKWKYQ